MALAVTGLRPQIDPVPLTQVVHEQAARLGAPSRPTIPALTSLRFFAALLVVLYHYKVLIPYPDFIARFADQGRTGVSFFFILSGFILVYNYHETFASRLDAVWRFYRARFARIYPMHVVALLLCTPATIYFLVAHPELSDAWSDRRLGLVELAASWVSNLTALQSYLPVPSFHYLWNTPSWSISTEFSFYLVFPFIMRYVIGRLVSVRSLLIVAGAAFLIELVSFLVVAGWITMQVQDSSELDVALDLFAYKVPVMRVWEFVIGCALGAVFVRTRAATSTNTRRSANLNNLAICASSLCIVGIVLLPARGSLMLLVLALKFYVLYTPAFAVLIFAIARSRGVIVRVLAHPFLVLLGEASYSVYIVHYVLWIVLAGLARTGTVVPYQVSVLAIGATILASIGFYKLIEVPARRALTAGRGTADVRHAKVATCPA